jgi:hypothetical protein
MLPAADPSADTSLACTFPPRKAIATGARASRGGAHHRAPAGPSQALVMMMGVAKRAPQAMLPFVPAIVEAVLKVGLVAGRPCLTQAQTNKREHKQTPQPAGPMCSPAAVCCFAFQALDPSQPAIRAQCLKATTLCLSAPPPAPACTGTGFPRVLCPAAS